MANIQRKLFELRYEIQRERATVNAIKRTLKRLGGREVHYTDPETDANRVRNQAFADPTNAQSMKTALPFYQQSLRELTTERTRLREELYSRFPLTPCALFAKLKYLKQKKKKKQQRLERKKRRRY